MFQSTLLRKERRLLVLPKCQICSFNPRSYERSDKDRNTAFWYHKSFNPRSYERSDTLAPLNVLSPTMFQSTLLRKERHKRMLYYNKHSSFNPRSYERSDVASTVPMAGVVLFQSTLLRKERQLCRQLLDLHILFQSTLLRKERRMSFS